MELCYAGEAPFLAPRFAFKSSNFCNCSGVRRALIFSIVCRRSCLSCARFASLARLVSCLIAFAELRRILHDRLNFGLLGVGQVELLQHSDDTHLVGVSGLLWRWAGRLSRTRQRQMLRE